MSLIKTAKIESPHSTYSCGDLTLAVLRVNAPAKGPTTEYATWLVSAKSPLTYGIWEYGDTYIADVLRYGTLESATDEFLEYLHA